MDARSVRRRSSGKLTHERVSGNGNPILIEYTPIRHQTIRAHICMNSLGEIKV